MVHLSEAPSKFQTNRYLTAFDSFEKGAFKKNPSWLVNLRKSAIGCFANLGFPTTRHESWKYTNAGPIAETPFEFAFDQCSQDVVLSQLEPFTFGQKGWPRLVFINGVFSNELSTVSFQSGLKITNIKSAFASDPKLLESYLAQVASYDQNAFAALNTAFVNDGALICLSEGTALDDPIHLLFVSSTQNNPLVSQPRTLILAGKNSRARILESHVSLCGGVYLTNAVTEIVLDEGALIEHQKLQRESERAFHVGTTHVRQNHGSRFLSFSADLGGKLVRNNLTIDLNAERAECELNGLYLVSGDQHVDNTTLIDHPKPYGTSRQLYKGLVSGKGRAVFFGKIFVHKDAQHTDASQTNKNLLLSESAVVDTRPQLEILNNDVKCTHGAAVGQLDEGAIFYLKTRGIGDKEAQRLLSYGFAMEVLDCVKLEPVHTELDRLILARLQDCSYFAWRDKRKEHG